MTPQTSCWLMPGCPPQLTSPDSSKIAIRTWKSVAPDTYATHFTTQPSMSATGTRLLLIILPRSGRRENTTIVKCIRVHPFQNGKSTSVQPNRLSGSFATDLDQFRLYRISARQTYQLRFAHTTDKISHYTRVAQQMKRVNGVFTRHGQHGNEPVCQTAGAQGKHCDTPQND